MKNSGKCPKCGGTEIIADAKAIDRGEGDWEQEMSVATFRHPEALIFKAKQSTTISAWVCSGCGYVELYADNPQKLRVQKD